MTTLITVDWGSSSLRAVLWQNGVITERIQSDAGVFKIADRQFIAALLSAIRPMLVHLPKVASIDIVMSGMIGSRNGWQEVPYVPCPATPKQLSQGLVRINANHPLLKSHRLWIVPGICSQSPDVMRGEETQLIGAEIPKDVDEVWLPGTHCKHVRLSDGRIESFRTFMTGELFGLLSGQGALKATDVTTASSEERHQAFVDGVRQGLNSDSALTADLFRIRAQTLTGQLAGNLISEYLSGRLIAEEFRHVQAARVFMIGEPELCKRYSIALNVAKELHQQWECVVDPELKTADFAAIGAKRIIDARVN